MWIATSCHIKTDDVDLPIAGLTVTGGQTSSNGIFQLTAVVSGYTYTAKNVSGSDLYNTEKDRTWPAGISYSFGHTDTSLVGNWHFVI